MKRLFLLLVLCSGFGFAQEYPKDAIELLIGKELKVLPKVEKTNYYNFYKKEDLSTRSRIVAEYDKFNGAIFKLNSFKRNDKGSIQSITLELYNEKIGKVYYEYEYWGMGFWIFEIIGGVQYPKDYWCKDITESFDKFTSVTSYSSPKEDRVYFYKDKDGIYLYLKSFGSTLNIGKTGITILLSDGSKIENNSTIIEVKASYDDYDYSAFFKLSESDIIKLKKAFITDYRLFIYDFKLDNGSLYQRYLDCLTK